jgi:sugar phosphate isomerase/epimerase
MKLGIINSAFGQAGVDTLTGLGHISRLGFDCVDIFTEAGALDVTERREIGKFCVSNNLPITSLPVVAIGLIDFNDPVREYHIERCKGFIDLAAEWSAGNILLVLGEYIWQREVIPPEEQWRWAIESCRILGDYAASKGVEIALELEPQVRANIDISHLALADNGPEELYKLRGQAIHVHISDCDGKVHGDLPPGRGIVKFAPYLQAIKELEIDGVVSIELEYSPEPSRIVEWVEEAYTATNRLMQQVGLRG